MSLGIGVLVFVKQKTAIKMRISDWSSDVCSSGLDEILFLGRRRVAAAAAALLRAIAADRLALGVARVRERDHHVFRGDQVEDVQVFLAGADLAATVVAELLLDVAQLGTDHLQRSEEHTSELQSLMRTSYAVFCLK